MTIKNQIQKKRSGSKLSLMVLCGMLAVCSAQAQYADSYSSDPVRARPKVGIKGGLNVSNLYVDQVNDEDARIGFHAGVFGQLFSSEAFAIQPEINFSTKGNRIVTSFLSVDQETKFNLSYLDIPVLAVFKLGRVVELHAGAYWSYLVSANIKTEGDLGSEFRDIDRDNFENWDYGLVGGVGINLSGIQLGARYNYGLQQIAKSNGAKSMLGDSKNSVGQVYIAFNLNP